jgi:transcriptional regulator with XRE-family HTH domain
MSQPVFARLLGLDRSAVAQWERGAKRPSGPALRVLEVLEPPRGFFTAQKPIRRATERDEAVIRTWLDHDYPAIVKQAKKQKAEIHWADETGISNQANYGRRFAPQDEPPGIPRPAARFTWL